MAMMNEVKSQTLFRFSKSSGYCSDSDVSDSGDGGDGDIAEEVDSHSGAKSKT